MRIERHQSLDLFDGNGNQPDKAKRVLSRQPICHNSNGSVINLREVPISQNYIVSRAQQPLLPTLLAMRQQEIGN